MVPESRMYLQIFGLMSQAIFIDIKVVTPLVKRSQVVVQSPHVSAVFSMRADFAKDFQISSVRRNDHSIEKIWCT